MYRNPGFSGAAVLAVYNHWLLNHELHLKMGMFCGLTATSRVSENVVMGRELGCTSLLGWLSGAGMGGGSKKYL